MQHLPVHAPNLSLVEKISGQARVHENLRVRAAANLLHQRLRAFGGLCSRFVCDVDVVSESEVIINFYPSNNYAKKEPLPRKSKTDNLIEDITHFLEEMQTA